MIPNATKLLPPKRTLGLQQASIRQKLLNGIECCMTSGFPIHGFISMHCCCKIGLLICYDVSGNLMTDSGSNTLYALRQR